MNNMWQVVKPGHHFEFNPITKEIKWKELPATEAERKKIEKKFLENFE